MVEAPLLNGPGRDTVLGAVAEALRGSPATGRPPAAPSEPNQPADSEVELVARFVRELAAINGEAYLIGSDAELPGAVADFCRTRGCVRVIAAPSPRARLAASRIAGARVTDERMESRDVESADCGIIEARALMADTGSAIVCMRTRIERLLPYLPPTCVIVAGATQIHAAMSSDAMRAFYEPALAGSGGEALIIAGPSRTADIEKELVLGAHGPRTVAVFITGANVAG